MFKIKESLANNSDIELVMSNVLVAKAQLNLVKAYRFAQINLSCRANQTKK
ncbi:RND efflux system, outer membrane protein [Rickettsia canadensis str. McKiel]|uniref:RND efflux system, outer membrane protein n=1 Tax=Rickettsia canadensis (strain McKiel) TaxID=293613 RepID=A8EZ12_RICCK|nr:RND efflux system, outer membrane protein [Rickettsia canadensis str. McKiel]